MWFLLFLLGAGLGVVAIKTLVEAAERQRLLAPPEKPPARLLTSTAAHVTTTDIAPKTDHAKVLCQIAITPAQEAFTSPLPPGVLTLIFSGTCAMKESIRHQWHGVDACFRSDDDDNYLKRHSFLVIDGKEFRQDPLESDRAAHRYTFTYHSKGGRIGVLLKRPHDIYTPAVTIGSIDLAVVWQSA